MNKMEHRHFHPLFMLAALLIIQLTPNPVRAWKWDENNLVGAPYRAGSLLVESPDSADIDGNGIEDIFKMEGASLSILDGEHVMWKSPPDWKVIHSGFTDLNQDNTPEVTLLVWRLYKPWPVDKFLPFGGRIVGHQDKKGYSCHLILVGWILDGYGELWAGSALANPIKTFRAADLDGDSLQELITLEGDYSDPSSSPARFLNIWEWNGFGFTIVLSKPGSFSDLAIVQEENNNLLVLTP